MKIKPAITISNKSLASLIISVGSDLKHEGREVDNRQLIREYRESEALIDIIIAEASSSKYKSFIDFQSKNGHNK